MYDDIHTCRMMIWKVRMWRTAEISRQASFNRVPQPMLLFILARLHTIMGVSGCVRGCMPTCSQAEQPS